MNYLIIIFLILLSGLFSGLTLSLLKLDRSFLKRKALMGNKRAVKVYEVRKKGNLLLCTLLLGNVAVNSALAIFLSDMTNGLAAGIISTMLIVIFGEIIPQATFSRYALKIGARTAWLVKIFIFLLFPICYPIALALDKILGDEMDTIYSKKELMEIIKEHHISDASDIDFDEQSIVRGALSFSDQTVAQIMTHKTGIYALDINRVLDDTTLNEIKNEGYTRIPVYEGSESNMVSMLYVKNLINIGTNMKIKDICSKKPPLIVRKEEKLDHLLNMFIVSKTHLAIVQNNKKEIEGVVSLEDVLEEIIKREIIDETD